MTTQTVTTQAELDAALAENVDWIEINSPAGVWLEVHKSDSSTVRASDSSTVRAYGSSTVRAYGSSTVRAYDSSTVRAYGSSTVRAYGSSTVTAYGSSTVRAYDSSTVRAYGSSTVTAYDSSTVRAYGSSTVTATPYTAIHLHSAHVHLTGGTVLDHTKVDLTDAKTWCEYHGVKVVKGVATVYKAVDDRYTTPRGFDYSPGATPDDGTNFNRENACGNGLHFGPTPTHALAYHNEATRFMAAQVAVKDLVPITDSTAKCKAPRVVAPLVEVTIDGTPTDTI